MALYTIAQYRVKPAAVQKTKHAIRDLVRHVREHEPGTQLYLAWQQKGDPTRFLHIFAFADEASQEAHSSSEAVKRFEAVYRPELVGGDVVFTDFDIVAAKLGHAPVHSEAHRS